MQWKSWQNDCYSYIVEDGDTIVSSGGKNQDWDFSAWLIPRTDLEESSCDNRYLLTAFYFQTDSARMLLSRGHLHSPFFFTLWFLQVIACRIFFSILKCQQYSILVMNFVNKLISVIFSNKLQNFGMLLIYFSKYHNSLLRRHQT